MLSAAFTRVVFAAKGDTIHADYGPLGGIAIQFV
jgi:2-oxo-hept-3-ene-1,7-dioate hydratase